MGKKIDEVTGETRYFIPVDGTYYETNEEVYNAYYKMERRERYLEERSQEFEKSYEGLQQDGFQIEMNSNAHKGNTENDAITTVMIEEMLNKLSVLNDYELWLIQEIYTHGKTVRQIEEESGIKRTTVWRHQKTILGKLRKELEK
jgi:DNA-directed RNA polymerase specialized sigma subunit